MRKSGHDFSPLCPYLSFQQGSRQLWWCYGLLSGIFERFLALLSNKNSPKDFSTNGFKLNEYWVRRSAALLMDGDILELPSSRRGNCLSPGTPEPTADPSVFQNLSASTYGHSV
jgi:hypothetical protein